MLDRMGKIGQIRDIIDELYEAGRFAIVKEIMGDLDRFNFSGVPDTTICWVWSQLVFLPHDEDQQ
jgi:hypothetical protein